MARVVRRMVDMLRSWLRANFCNVAPSARRLDPALGDTFQSTPLREGRRPEPSIARHMASSFNPRPCARGDPSAIVGDALSNCFNPRPCARGDRHHPSIAGSACVVSIHAPARGATLAGTARYCGEIRFQSTPLREGRLARVRCESYSMLCFNPRPCARGDARP